MQNHNFTHEELLKLSPAELDAIIASETSVLDTNFIYHYQSKEHLLSFIQDIRSFPLDDTKFYMYLGNNLMIHDIRSRCLVNALIAVLLDNYDVNPAIRKEFIFTQTYDKGKPGKYMDNILYHLRLNPIVNEQIFLPHLLSDIKQQFYLLAIIVNGVVSMDHSMYDYLKAYERNTDYQNIIDNPAYDYTMTPMEINERTKYLGGMLEHDVLVDPLTDFFKAGIKINKQQVQSLFSYGFIPNPVSSHLKSMIKPIVGGFLNGFLTKYDQYAVDLMGVIALHRGKAEVKEPGLINKRLTTALSIVRLNRVDTRETLSDCGSNRYFSIHIKDESDLKFFRYKFFKPLNNDINPRSPKPAYDFIDIDRKDLIGKTLQVRSIMLCDTTEDVICESCTGYNYKFFQDNGIHKNHLGSFVAAKISDVIQMTISILVK